MLIDKFLTYLTKERNYSRRTVEAYGRDIRSFEQFLQDIYGKSLTDADVKAVRRWVVYLSSTGLDPRSVNRKLTALRSFYKFLLKTGDVASNPAAGVPGLKIRKKQRVPLSEKEVQRLLDEIEFPDNFSGWRDKAVLQTFYDTGMRRAELIDMTERSIDWDNHLLRIKGKGNKERLIPMLPELEETLKTYLHWRRKTFPGLQETDPFFVTDKGKKLYEMFVHRLIERYLSLVSSKEKRSPHMLRHSFATHMLNRGADLNTIKELLGHAGLAATQHYLHAGIQELKRVYQAAHPRARKK